MVAAIAVTAVVAGLIGGVAGAGLGPAFSDVDEGHTFYDEIAWLARVGVAEGYPDGTYRPSQPVNRGSMAAFLQRLFDVQDDLAVRSNTAGAQTSSTAWSVIPNTLVEVQVPPGAAAYVVARFSAESACYGDFNWCSVRLMLDDGTGFKPMAPASQEDFAFDSSDGDTESAVSWEAHSMERWSTVSGGCTCRVRAEFRVNDGMFFDLDDYTIVAQTDLLPSGESFP